VPTRLLALLAALALLISACGDADDSAAPADDTTTTTAADTDTETTEGTAPAGDTPAPGETRTLADIALRAEPEPSRFEGTITVVGATGADMEGPVEIRLSGAVDPEADSTQMAMDMAALVSAAMEAEAGGAVPPELADLFTDPFEIITIGETTWLRFPLFTMMLGTEAGQWLEIPEDEAGDLTAGFGLGDQANSPTAFLEQFRDAEVDVEELGTATVRGVETTHYRLLIDVDAVAAQLPPEEQAEMEATFGGQDLLPVEVWVGDDGRLYRYRSELTSAMADDPDVESAVMEVEFFDYGAEVAIAPPPADQVTRLDDLGAPGAIELEPAD
jgi:hypothetical protein